MSRYIDIETIKPRQYENSEVELGVLAYDYDEVDAMPFLDIVRCKECVKRMREDCPMCNCCKLDRVPTEDDDFCSYGERREP